MVTDSLLLQSAADLATHRERQLAIARDADPRTDQGRALKKAVIELLASPSLSNGEYGLAFTLPLVVTDAVQRALGFFAGDEHREDMAAFRVWLDQEAAPMMRYGDASLLPSIGGDPRFRWTLPNHWRDEPVHPLLINSRHPDGDGLRPQAILSEMTWVNSEDHACVQIADVVAWVLRRALARPDESATLETFELIRPLLAGEGGATFKLWGLGEPHDTSGDRYSHLQRGVEPNWWLTPLTA